MAHEIPAIILAIFPPDDQARLEGLSRQDAYAWAMSKRSQVEEYLSCLSALQNSTIPVSRLPNELLVEIMYHVRDTHQTHPAVWIRVAQVCRYWRTVALSTPQLWTTIDLRTGEKDRLQLLQTCLHRSGQSLLDISLMSADVSFPLMLEQIQSHAHRIENLRLIRILRDEEQSGTSVLNPLLVSSMPELKTLTLSGLSILDTPTFALSAENMPQLQSLSLSKVRTPWDPLTSMSLVRLKLEHQGPVPSIDLFLDVLSANRGLEQLSLRYAGPRPVSTEHVSPSRRAFLPNLCNLTLENYPGIVSYQFSHLNLPNVVYVNVIAQYDGSNARQGYLSAIPPGGVALPPLSTARSLVIDVESRHYCLQASSADLDFFDSEPSASFFDITHWRNRDARSVTLRKALRELTQVFSYLQVVNMHITCSSSVDAGSERVWREVLECFHLLQRLEIEDYSDKDIRPLLHALGGPHSQIDKSICPGLKILQFNGLFFEQSHVDTLLSCLEGRASLGMRLDTLKLEIRTQRPLLTDAVFDRLRSCVSNPFDSHETY